MNYLQFAAAQRARNQRKRKEPKATIDQRIDAAKNSVIKKCYCPF